MVKQTSQKSMSWLTGLSIVHFSNDVMEMAISPLLPLIIKEFSLTYLMAALILVSFKTLPSFVQLVIALVSDASSKRKITIILGLGWLSIGLWFVSISPNYTVLIVSVLIVGIGTTTYHSQATVYIAHYFSEVRGKGMGIHGIGGGLARIVTPIILGVFGLFFGWRVALRFITIPGIICVVILAIMLKEIGSSKRVRIRIREAISRPAILLTTILSLRTLAFVSISSFLPTFFVVQMDTTIAVAGILTSIVFISNTLGQPFWGWISDRMGRRKVFIVTIFMQAIFIVFFVLLPYPLDLVGLLCLGFFAGAHIPVGLAFASEVAPSHLIATTISIIFGISMGISTAATAITGIIIDLHGFYVAFLLLPLFSSVVAGILAFNLPRKREKRLLKINHENQKEY